MQLRRLISFLVMAVLKLISKLFYRMEVNWIGHPLQSKEDWQPIRVIAFLNHTSLFEPLFIEALPLHYLWRMAKRMVAPGADKTLDRPIVGLFWKLMAPGMTSITRKRDHTWKEFIRSIAWDSIIIIAPEGRMKRANGLDLNGNKMTVKPGIADVLREIDEGKILFAYSGGLHHIQVPGQKLPKIFKKLKMNIEAIDIIEYKKEFHSEGNAWIRDVVANMQQKLEANCPN